MELEYVYVVSGIFGEIIGVYTTRRKAQAAVRRTKLPGSCDITKVVLNDHPKED